MPCQLVSPVMGTDNQATIPLESPPAGLIPRSESERQSCRVGGRRHTAAALSPAAVGNFGLRFSPIPKFRAERNSGTRQTIINAPTIARMKIISLATLDARLLSLDAYAACLPSQSNPQADDFFRLGLKEFAREILAATPDHNKRDRGLRLLLNHFLLHLNSQ